MASPSARQTGHFSDPPDPLDPSQSEALLAGVAEAAKCLLSVADFEAAFATALAVIATAADIDRIYVLKHYPPADSGGKAFATLAYEWVRPGIAAEFNLPERWPLVYEQEGLSDWLLALQSGQPVQWLAQERSAIHQSPLAAGETLSLLAVPIFIEDTYWGNVGFDDFATERVWSTGEISGLETAAVIFAGALQRQSHLKDIETYMQTLKERDRILAATAAASTVLLAEGDFDTAVNSALQILAESVECDRVAVCQHFDDPTGETVGFFRFLYDWDPQSRPSHIPCYTLFQDIYWRDLDAEDWFYRSVEGEAIGQTVETLPDPFRQAKQLAGTLSVHSIPIFVEGQFWGLFTTDHRRESKLLSETELVIFKTAANCIGNAIQRERTTKAREAAEREALIAGERAARAAELKKANQVLTTRDRWLETTAIAANQLLSGHDVAASVNAALRTIGENLACDRVIVICHIPSTNPDSTERSLGSMRLLYEWDAPDITAQMEDSVTSEFCVDGIEDWVTPLMAGQWMGGHVDSLPESVRRDHQQLGILSTYAMPIFVDEQFWGIMRLDHCREAKRFSPSEIMVFETAAACVGSTIYQDMIRRDRAAQDRARLLSSVAEAANLLLKSADYQRVLPAFVRLLGESVDSDRCGIFKVCNAANNVSIVALWERPGIALPFADVTGITPLAVLEIFSSIFEQIARGESLNFVVADMEEPARTLLMAQGCASVLIVPIMIQGEYSGSNIAFDNCTKPRLYDDAEIAILQLAADSIAGAISRQAQDEALRKSEERYRTLFEISSAGIYRFAYDQPIPLSLPIDEQIKLVYQNFYFAEGNRTMAAMYAFEKPEDLIGIRLREISVTGAEESFDCVRAYVNDPEHQVQNYESEELYPNGEIRYFLNNILSFIKAGYAYGGWGSQLDITDLKQAQKATEAAEKAVLEERNRLAREIHDTLAQSFTGISLQLEAAKGILNRNPTEAQSHIDRAGNLARRGLSEARRSVRALRSQALETDSLPTALPTALQEMTQNSALQSQFHLTGVPYALPEDLQTNLLRIGQEAITNTLRHAQANILTLTLQFAPSSVNLTITDDGQGCEIASFNEVEGFGLLGMRERTMRLGGEFYFTSAPGRGTIIEIMIPIQEAM